MEYLVGRQMPSAVETMKNKNISSLLELTSCWEKEEMRLTSECITQETQTRISKKYLYTHAHFNIIRDKSKPSVLVWVSVSAEKGTMTMATFIMENISLW